MNIIQDSSLLLGSPEDITALSQKDSARVLVISDSHGFTAQLLYSLLEEGAKCDCLIFCGDGIGDVCSALDRAQTDASLAACIPPVIALVAGNCDTEFYSLDSMRMTIQIPLMQTLTIAGHTVLCTHGHRFSLYNGTDSLEQAAKRSNANIVLYGHTHVAHRLQQGQLLIANPGSCARPRSNQPPCYAVLSLQKDAAYPDFTVYQISTNGSSPYTF